jgi:hypothetical protein
MQAQPDNGPEIVAITAFAFDGDYDPKIEDHL